MAASHPFITLAKRHLSTLEYKYAELYPDTIPYSCLSSAEYLDYFNTLAGRSRRDKNNYYHVDDYQIKRVGAMRYYWESVRGILGFENHCDPVRVNMALRKFVYYGCANHSLNSYHFENLVPGFSGNVVEMQNKLIAYYNAHADALRPSFWQRAISRTREFLLPRPTFDSYTFGGSIAEIARMNTGRFTSEQSDLLYLVNCISPQSKAFEDKYLDFIHRMICTDNRFLQSIKKDSALALALANKFIADNNKDSFSYVEQLASWGCNPPYFFKHYVAVSKFDQAYDVMSNCDQRENLCMAAKAALAKHYMETAERKLVLVLIRHGNDNPASTGHLLSAFVSPLQRMLGWQNKESVQREEKLDWNTWYSHAARALQVDAAIKEQHLSRFAQFNLYRRNYQEAMALILRIEDINVQFALVTKNPEDEANLIYFIEKDSPLAIKLAKHYIEKDRYKYAAQIEYLASWMRNVANLTHYFDHFFNQGRFDEAYEVYSSATNKSVFNAKNVTKLAEYYSKQGEEEYDVGYSQRGSNLENVYSHYRVSLKCKKKAFQVVANDKNELQVHIHRRLVAQSLFNVAADKNMLSADMLDKVIKKYQKSYSYTVKAVKKDGHLVPNYLDALEKRSELAINQCLDPLSHCDGVGAEKEHTKRCQAHISKAIECLRMAIDLMKKPTSTEEKKRLARFHFELGNLMRFFSVDGAMYHINKAAKLAPSNPFYAALAAEVYGTPEQRDKAWKLFPKHNMNPTVYFLWKDERWHAKKIQSTDIGDIHQYHTESVLKRLISRA